MPSSKFLLRLDKAHHAALKKDAAALDQSLNELCLSRLAVTSPLESLPAGVGHAVRSLSQIAAAQLVAIVIFGSWARGDHTATIRRARPCPDADEMFQGNAAITAALGASVQSKIAFGPRAGQQVRKIGKGFGYEEEVPLAKGVKCATINGFNLHAATYVGPQQRDRLERLVAYVTRPPLAVDRLSVTPDGDLIYMMKRRFADGTQAIMLSPCEIIEKVCAMVPPPRSHQILYTGVFSSHSQWRNLIALDAKARKGFNPETVDRQKVKNHKWAKLLMRIFKIDVGACPKCGGDMEIRAALHEPAGIRCYLQGIGLAEHPPPIAPSRYEQARLATQFDEAQDQADDP